MRILKVYKHWTSPHALVSAVLSKESITAVFFDCYLRRQFILAIGKAKQLFLAAAYGQVKNLLWLGAILGFLTWPLFKIPMEIKHFLQTAVGIMFVVSVCRFVHLLIKRYRFYRFEQKDSMPIEYEHTLTKLTPTAIAHRRRKIKNPSLKYALATFGVMVLMNCWMIASPAYPAKIGKQYIVASAFVPPWTSWENTVKVQQGSMLAIITAPETDQIYVARARYVVRRIGFPESLTAWEEWMINHFSAVTRQVTQALYERAPATLPADEWASWILEAWETPEEWGTPLMQVRDVLVRDFQTQYSQEFELLSLELNIEHISYSKYRKEIQK